MLVLPFKKAAPGIYLLAFDVEDVRRHAAEVKGVERLFAIMDADVAMRFDADGFASGARAAQALGIRRMDFRVAADGFDELVEVGDDRVLRDDEGVRPEVRNLRLPVNVHALDERDDRDDRADADGDAEQRQKRAQ